MKTKLGFLALLFISMFGMTACSDDIEDAGDEVGDAIEDVADETSDAVN